jgi:hypothetical protein
MHNLNDKKKYNQNEAEQLSSRVVWKELCTHRADYKVCRV